MENPSPPRGSSWARSTRQARPCRSPVRRQRRRKGRLENACALPESRLQRNMRGAVPGLERVAAQAVLEFGDEVVLGHGFLAALAQAHGVAAALRLPLAHYDDHGYPLGLPIADLAAQFFIAVVDIGARRQ